MKEIGPIAGICHENTMTEINYAEGIDHQSITKTIMKESIIAHFRTMEIGENIKIITKTGLGMTISMILTDPMIQMIHMVEIGHMTETGHIVEIGTTPQNTKETRPILEINDMTEILIVEIDCKTSVEMSIRRKIINIRQGLEIIMKISMRTGMVGININTNTELTNKTKLEIDKRKNLTHTVIKVVTVFIQNSNNCSWYSCSRCAKYTLFHS